MGHIFQHTHIKDITQYCNIRGRIHNGVCCSRSACLLLLFLGLFLPSKAQYNIHDYTMVTGTDSSLWISIPSATCQNNFDSTTLDLGFNFLFMGQYYSQFYFGNHGELYLGHCSLFYPYDTYLPFSEYETIHRPIIAPYGCRGWLDNTCSICYAILGSEGHHILVATFDIARAANQTPHNVYQVQLREEDGSILFVYQHHDGDAQYLDPQTGFAANDNSVHRIYRFNHSHCFGKTISFDQAAWPSNYRYYRFTPEGQPPCQMSFNPRIAEVTTNTALFSWDPSSEAASYRVHFYAIDDSATTSRIINSSQNSCQISNLIPGAHYHISVRAVCPNGGFSISQGLEFYTICESYGTNPIHFADIHASSVTCRIGDYSHPSSFIQTVDYGPDDVRSRHTVHTDPNEYDPRTGYALKVIPNGECRVVRLGNWSTGSEQEDITYQLSVDSNSYDLLLIHYAIVDQNPSHTINNQPRFELSIKNAAGQLLSSCDQRDFISGINTYGGDWNEYEFAGSVLDWHDWDVMGINLTPYHGSTIYVTISNYDCSMGGHFGYGYLILEGSTKRFRTSSCGYVDTNTFTAPEGFAYRWYRQSNPSVTLSTSRSYTVTDSCVYCCRASFIGADSNCGFTMRTELTPRFPHADFSYESRSECDNVIQFYNHSRVASNAACTNLTNEHCDSIRWFFGNGFSSTANNPIHTFPPGDHTVFLVAYLANGTCSDTASVVIHTNYETDTITRYFCPGHQYQYNGIFFTDTGYYSFDSSCHQQILHLCHYPTSSITLMRSFCQGGSYTYNGQTFYVPGTYPFRFPDTHNCDSMVYLKLSTYIYDSTKYADTICDGDEYFFNGQSISLPGSYADTLTAANGCDSILTLELCVRPIPTLQYVDSLACGISPYHILLLPVTQYTYAFRSEPVDSCFSYFPDSNYCYLFPRSNSLYYFTLQYPDEPYCTAVEAHRFDSLGSVQVKLEISPEALSPDQLEFRAVDKGKYVSYRDWFVNGNQLDETGPIIFSEATLKDSLVIVTLVGHNLNCTDTACDSIPILRHSLFFPNIFTPSLTTNNLFRPYHTHIYDYELWVYDRRGDLVFHTTNPDQGWDGTHEGRPVPQGAYVYTCRYACPNAGAQNLTGTVLLIR